MAKIRAVRVVLEIEVQTDLSVQEAAEALVQAVQDWGSLPAEEDTSYVSVLTVLHKSSREIGPAPKPDMDRQ